MNETPATTKVVNVVIPAGYLKAGRTIMQNEAGQALPDAVGVYGHPSLGTNEILSVYCHTSGELAYVILSRSGRWIRGGFVSDLPHGNWLPAAAQQQLADNPEMDATDFAHPAWWRGHEHTTAVLCQMVNKILDGKDGVAGVASEPWESTRRRLRDLQQQLSEAVNERNVYRVFIEAATGEVADVVSVRKLGDKLCDWKDRLAKAERQLAEARAECERVTRENSELKFEAMDARDAAGAVMAELEWNGDGYSWNPKAGDYRENPHDALARHAAKLKAERETAEAALAETLDLLTESEAALTAANELAASHAAELETAMKVIQDDCETEENCRAIAAKVLGESFVRGDSYAVPPMEELFERLVSLNEDKHRTVQAYCKAASEDKAALTAANAAREAAEGVLAAIQKRLIYQKSEAEAHGRPAVIACDAISELAKGEA